MTDQTNKRVVLAYVEAFNRGDMDAMRALFTDDAIVHGVLGEGPLEAVIPMWRELHNSLRITLTIESIAVAGDTVALRCSERGTFVRPFLGHAPTGQTYEMVAMEWFELRDGKIARRWGARDAATQARQFGIAAARAGRVDATASHSLH